MKTIVEVKEGILGNVLGILFLTALCGFLYWLYSINRVPLIVVIAFCAVFFVVCLMLIQNIRAPKSARLFIDGDKVGWSVRHSESEEPDVKSLPLRSVRCVEFVLPRMRFHVNATNYPLSEMFIVDIYENRHQVPMELWPGVNRDKIVKVLQENIPSLQVTERIGDLAT